MDASEHQQLSDIARPALRAPLSAHYRTSIEKSLCIIVLIRYVMLPTARAITSYLAYPYFAVRMEV
jgi:hypothetical protein